MKKNILIILLFMMLVSCSKFLEEKPDQKMVIPKTLKDAELLLSDYSNFNTGYPVSGEWGTDDYFIADSYWDELSNPEQKSAYVWADKQYDDVTQWQSPYRVVYLANQVLAMLSDLQALQHEDQYKKVLGTAYFFRAFAFHQVTEVFAPAYSVTTAGTAMGIPLRLSADMDIPSVRASLAETYSQIIADYKMAISNLPVVQPVKGHPNRAAAYGSLARVYLGMANYEEAFKMANSALLLNATLLNFNSLNQYDELPIPQFNKEVLFPAVTSNAGLMNYYNAFVEPVLYQSYQEKDLRKKIFFQLSDNVEGAYNFKGNYANSMAQLFVGITTSEVYLIKAETAARLNKVEEAQETLNTLLRSRWQTGEYVDITVLDAGELLEIILQERRKELLFRGRRWADLKRLNLEAKFKKDLIRTINGQEYRLPFNSLKYAFRLPDPVVKLGNISQNER
ncbi:RagB/SusD family nutrient uptake outer membrane protein [Sphingobacterium kitahiroshimense]|uniref:RagB/SusD family nutrient uptake outer membrane protein n=1 Tax=Sphingobacterium sp. B16(2022) TaxID=2914044 RepID=UPI00143C2A2A|nr:RagB/SusD family nutrient uptake outer membrane protein [Sphingobacterium sp. B16(2022)]NJI72308.1 RagB/SusD family nutrient uptake outer membrane protein [Sphingobacterium sp. B16(2022)]